MLHDLTEYRPKKPQLGFIGLNIVQSNRHRVQTRKYYTIQEVRAFKDNLLSYASDCPSPDKEVEISRNTRIEILYSTLRESVETPYLKTSTSLLTLQRWFVWTE